MMAENAMRASRPRVRLASFFLLATPAAVAAASSLEIIPQGIDCVVADRFPRIEALLTPAEEVSLARVFFRTKDSEGWYWVRMEREVDRFVALLPKPTKGLKAFRYYFEATDAEFGTIQTPEYVPQVVPDAETCHGKMVAKAVASGRVITHVPTGYKVPAVPGGFSVRGTLRAGEEEVGVFPHMSLTAALLGAGVVGAGVVAVGLAVAKPTNANLGAVTLLDSNPPPGSTISLNGGSLMVNLRLITTRDVWPGPLILTLEGSQGPGSPYPCVSLSSAPLPGFAAGSPQNVSVSGLSSSSCPAPFTVREGRLVLPGKQGSFVLGVAANYYFVR
jgi:hypothetical protein